MPVSKIKNLILLILALATACLLLLVIPLRLSDIRAEEALHAQIEELFSSYDIALDRSILPRSASLYGIELGGQAEDSAVAAAALLGAEAAPDEDSTHYASTYTSPQGSCTLRADGGFTAALTGGQSSTDLTAAAQTLLKRMGFETEALSAPERLSAGVYTLHASQRILGVPVLSDGLSLTYTNGALTRCEGTFFTGVSALSRTSEDACISCADALTALLSRREALGWVGGSVVSVRQCYRPAGSASASLRLTPVWLIETDTGSFCVNGLTREVSVWTD